MGIKLYEHLSYLLEEFKFDDEFKITNQEDYDQWAKCHVRQYKNNSGKIFSCYNIQEKNNGIHVEADYYIGLDWLLPGERFIHIEPKINKNYNENFNKKLTLYEEQIDEVALIDAESENLSNNDSLLIEIDYLKILLSAMTDEQVSKHCKDLIRIEWDEQKISIEQTSDQLTPFLIVQFLQLLKQLLRKGLKKSYYKVEGNLNSSVKGKILVSQQIKQNILKNRFTKTYCKYQIFGVDNNENRFLKKAFRFATSYIENNKRLFKGHVAVIENIANYCRPHFELIGDTINEEQLRHFKFNPFFKEYKEAIKIGQYILKGFSYNISKTVTEMKELPPFWIDMPRLFELYVYQRLIMANPEKSNCIHYQFSTYGNSLDVLIADKDHSMVIDAKYKRHYSHGQIHEDIRQVAGYARLIKVLNEVKKVNAEFDRDKILPCLIIYPDINSGIDVDDLGTFTFANLLNENNILPAYHKVYKLGIKLPLIQ